MSCCNNNNMMDDSEPQKQETGAAEVEMGVPTEYDGKNVEELKHAEHQEQEEGDRWYLADDGVSYFMDRREPFFRFNLLAFVVSMGAFIYLTVVITKDYIDQKANPPTSTKITKDVLQSFPGMILCNRDANTPLTVISGWYENTSGENSEEIDISGQIQPIGCSNNCVILDGNFPAFGADPDDANACRGSNYITIALDVNLDSYDNSTIFAGLDGYLIAPDSGATTIEAFCANSAPSCQASLPSSDDCPEDISALAFEPFVASSSEGTLISLTRTEIQHSPKCGQVLLSWNPIDTTMYFVPSSLAARGLDIVDSVVLLVFAFTGPRVSKTTYNAMSGQSMFGSLSGWFGFLTDGWGSISILLFTERTFLFLRNRFRS
jgi:hypothetical protein